MANFKHRPLKFATLFLFALSLHAQAVITDYPQPVRTVTIGATHCTIWLHTSAAPGYDSEIACYQPNVTPLIEAFPSGMKVGESFEFAVGSISFLLTPNIGDPSKIDYQICGQGLADAVAVKETGTL